MKRAFFAALLGAALATLAAATVTAATPDPTRGVGNDPRSPGEGPGLVGDPAFAIGLVLVIAVVATAATILYVRLTRPPAAGR